jgi:hypothetical protein
MRELTNSERIKLANLVTRDDWALAVEIMETALHNLRDVWEDAPIGASDKEIANRQRMYIAAKRFYNEYLISLAKEIQRGQEKGIILPDVTEELLGTKPNQP